MLDAYGNSSKTVKGSGFSVGIALTGDKLPVVSFVHNKLTI